MEQIPEPYDFHLDSKQEERARRLYRDSIVIDMLFQGPCAPNSFTSEFDQPLRDEYERTRNLEQVIHKARTLPLRLALRGEFPSYREWWEASGITAAATGMGGATLTNNLVNYALMAHGFDVFDWLVKALKPGDIRRAKTEGKPAAFLGTQDTTWLNGDLDNLDVLYHYGLRVVQLTYNNMNSVGAGCTERTDAGVSNLGERFIERMNSLGMIVDTGHCGRQTTLDAVALSHTAVIASHTTARAMSGHARGKGDEELEALAGCGGVIGVATLPAFLTSDPNPTIEHWLDHVDYIARLVGPEHVGIGTDWPLCMPDWCVTKHQAELAPKSGFRPQDRLSTTEKLRGVRDCRSHVNFARGLVARDYSDGDIMGILGGNWLRVIDSTWK